MTQAVNTALLGWVGAAGVYYVNPTSGSEDHSGKSSEVAVATIDQAYALASVAGLTSFQVVLSAGVSHAMPTSNPDANISFVTQNGALPFGAAPAINAGTWNAPSSRKYTFVGINFKGNTTFAGDSIEHRLCACETGSVLTFTAAKVKSYGNDFSRSTSCAISCPTSSSPAVVVDADGTDWGNNLSVSGSSETSSATLRVLDDVLTAPSIQAYGKLYHHGGEWVAKTNGSASIGMATNGYVYAQGVRAVRPDGSDGTINFQGGTKEFIAVDYASSGNTDNSTDNSPAVDIKVKGLLTSTLNPNQVYVDTRVGDDALGVGTLNAPYKTVTQALSVAQYPCYMEVATTSAPISEPVSIPKAATNIQFGSGNKNTRAGTTTFTTRFSVNYADSGDVYHTYRGFTHDTGSNSLWSVTNGVANPSIYLQDEKFKCTVACDIAPQPTNFAGTLVVNNCEQSSAPLASLYLYAGARYVFINQVNPIACSFPSGTGTGTTIEVNASCNVGSVTVPITYTGALKSYNPAITTVVGVIHTQAALTALLASTNTGTYPDGLYIVSGFAPTQNAALKGAVIGHAVVNGFAYNWLERQPAFAPASVVDATGITWDEYPSGVYLPKNLSVTAFLTAAPTGATAAGYYIRTDAGGTGYAANDIIYTDGAGSTYRACTYANAPSSVILSSGSTAKTYIKDGAGSWMIGGNVSAIYARLSKVASQSTNIVNGGVVLLDSVDQAHGGGVSLNTSTGQITIPAGIAVEFYGGIPAYQASGAAVLSYGFYNETDNTWIGHTGGIIGSTAGATYGLSGGQAYASLPISLTPKVITFRLQSAGSVTVIGANSDLPAGASLRPWVTVSALAGMQLSSTTYPSEPNWVNAGTIQSVGWGATTTAPTIGTSPTTNAVLYKQLGVKTWAVELVFNDPVSSGMTTGSGDYLFTLPNGLKFDLTVPGQDAYTGSIATSTWLLFRRVLPKGIGKVNNDNAGSVLYVIPYDQTRFRLLGLGIAGVGSVQCLGGGFYQVTANQSFNVQFEFQAQ